MLAHEIEIVEHREHGAGFAMPAADDGDQVVDGARVDGIEGLVEQDDLRVLEQHAGEERALQLAAGKRVDAARLEAGEADRLKRVVDRIGDRRQ